MTYEMHDCFAGLQNTNTYILAYVENWTGMWKFGYLGSHNLVKMSHHLALLQKKSCCLGQDVFHNYVEVQTLFAGLRLRVL